MIDCSKLKNTNQTGNETNRQEVVLIATGSFSPITFMHLRLLELARDKMLELGFNVSGAFITPVSDHYNKTGLISSVHRIEMCKLSVQDSNWINVDEWECQQPNWSTTRTVLESIEKRLKSNGIGSRPMLVVGSDVVKSFRIPDLWDAEDLNKILGYYGCIVIERINSDISEYVFEDPILYNHRKTIYAIKQHVTNDISSTKIRLFIKRGLSIKYLLSDLVMKYISDNKLYN